MISRQKNHLPKSTKEYDPVINILYNSFIENIKVKEMDVTEA
jgi:hypothetical protein